MVELAEQVKAFEEEKDEFTDGRVEPSHPLETPAVPEANEIPGSAKGTLRRGWTGYRAAVANGSEYQDAHEQFEASPS